MSSMILMQGIPGSGKSNMARVIAAATPNGATILSTDEYWYTQMGNNPAVYDFDVQFTADAHRWNQRRCAEAMVKGENVIIDNTNIKREAVKPYQLLAAIFEYQVAVVRVEVSLELALLRNNLRPEDRKVPGEVINRMHKEMEYLLL